MVAGTPGIGVLVGARVGDEDMTLVLVADAVGGTETGVPVTVGGPVSTLVAIAVLVGSAVTTGIGVASGGGIVVGIIVAVGAVLVGVTVGAIAVLVSVGSTPVLLGVLLTVGGATVAVAVLVGGTVVAVEVDGAVVLVNVGGTAVSVGVPVGSTAVSVGVSVGVAGTAELVGVPVGGTDVFVGVAGTAVSVAVLVGGTAVSVGVSVGGTAVFVGVSVSGGDATTTIVPDINGWILHWYGNVPVVVNTSAKVAPGLRTPESQTPVVLVVVWATVSLLVHVTVVPTVTVSTCGENAKLAMVTAAPADAASGTVGAVPAPPATLPMVMPLNTAVGNPTAISKIIHTHQRGRVSQRAPLSVWSGPELSMQRRPFSSRSMRSYGGACDILKILGGCTPRPGGLFLSPCLSSLAMRRASCCLYYKETSTPLHQAYCAACIHTGCGSRWEEPSPACYTEPSCTCHIRCL